MSSKKKTSAKSNVPQSVDTKTLEREGQKFLSTGNYDGAIASWNRLLKIRGGINAPINTPLLTKLAEANLLAASAVPVNERLPYLLAACRALPDSSAMLLRLLQFCRETGNWQAAIGFCQEMVQDKSRKQLFERLSYLVTLARKGTLPKQSPFSGDDHKRIDALTMLIENKAAKGLQGLGLIGENEYHVLVKALFHMHNNELPAAKTLLETAAASTGQEVVVLFAQYYLAVIMVRQGQCDEAENVLLPSLARMQKYPYFTNAPRQKRVASLLADLALRKAQAGDLEKAVNLWETALAWDNHNVNIIANLNHASAILASEYSRQGKLEKALPFWQNLCQKHPDNIGFAKNLALTYQKLERFGEATACWERVVAMAEQACKRDKDVSRSRAYLTQCYTQQALCCAAANRGADAERAYLNLVELEPQNLGHKSALAAHYLDERQLKRAFTVLEELVAREPQNIAHMIDMGLAYDLADNTKSAVQWWEKAMAQRPATTIPFELLRLGYHRIANLAYRHDKPDEALLYLDKLLAINPKDQLALALKGVIFLKKGERAQAERLFAEMIAGATEPLEAHLTIGRLCLEQRQVKDAEHYFNKAQQLGGDKNPAHDILAKIGFLYLQQDLVAYNEKDRRVVKCQNLASCSQGYAYFEKAVAAGGYDVALPIVEFLLELNCDRLPEMAQKAHSLKPQEATPLFYMALYHMKHRNQEKFESVLKMAQESPDFANNKQMQELVKQLEQLKQIFKLPQK